jgi:hypothetical protein
MSVSQKSPRAEKARDLLQQCRYALEELRKDPTIIWFVLWAGILGLVRTVGDTLEKDTDIRIRKAQRRWFDKMKRDNANAGRGTSMTKDGNTWGTRDLLAIHPQR